MQSSAQIAPAPHAAPAWSDGDHLDMSHYNAAAQIEVAGVRVLAAVLCTVFVALPFIAVEFPPSTDLPQHVAQIRLFLAALSDPESGYRIQWLTPYSAVYALLGGVSAHTNSRRENRAMLSSSRVPA